VGCMITAHGLAGVLFFFCPTSLLKEELNGIHQGAPQKCPKYSLMGKMGIKLCKE